jgi:large conductance mechanosensitive channel
MKVKKTKFFSDFKDFIAKGNVVDLAIAVVIGGAFNKIVTSLVNDIIMPIIGLIAGRVNITDLKWIIAPAVYDEAGNITKAEASLNYGNFIQNIIDFLIVAFTIFIVLRSFTKLVSIKEKIIKNGKDEEKEEEKAEGNE